jgi:hypothetical protein
VFSWLGLPELAQAMPSERRQAAELFGEVGGPDRGQAVGPAAVLRRQRLDQAAFLEPSESRVQGSRPQRSAGRLFDVGHDRVAVLGAIGQADQDEQRRFGEPSEFGDRWVHLDSRSYDRRYIDTRYIRRPERAVKRVSPSRAPYAVSRLVLS